MGIRDPFAGAARDAARGLRRLPAEVKKVAGREVKDKVADPLAEAVRAAHRRNRRRWGAALANATKTRVNVEPVIVVGGAAKIVSGGASGRQIVYGDEFGSGEVPQRAERLRRRAENGTGRRGSRTRGTTAQFAGPGTHAVFGTFAERAEETYNAWLDVLDEPLERWAAGELD